MAFGPMRTSTILPASSPDTFSSIRSPWQWLTFATIFAPAMYVVLIIDALVRGNAAYVWGPALFILLFTILWLGTYAVRTRIPRTASFARYLTEDVIAR